MTHGRLPDPGTSCFSLTASKRFGLTPEISAVSAFMTASKGRRLSSLPLHLKEDLRGGQTRTAGRTYVEVWQQASRVECSELRSAAPRGAVRRVAGETRREPSSDVQLGELKGCQVNREVFRYDCDLSRQNDQLNIAFSPPKVDMGRQISPFALSINLRSDHQLRIQLKEQTTPSDGHFQWTNFDVVSMSSGSISSIKYARMIPCATVSKVVKAFGHL